MLTPQELSVIILALVGTFIQLLFAYVPKIKTWYENNTNKGLVTLAVVFLFSLGYFLIGCTSLAAELGIAITCDVPGAYVMFQAFFIIAVSQQLTYSFLRNNALLGKKK